MKRSSIARAIQGIVCHPRKFLARLLLEKARIRVERVQPRPEYPGDRGRLEYQREYIQFEIGQADTVLDIGSGGDPFPHATVLLDCFPGETVHRFEPLCTGGKRFITGDVCQLPFPDKSFDFVYCSHVLEHVGDPMQACREIMRVGKRGYIETPTLAKDMLFCWAKNVHRWHVLCVGNRLCFVEYSARQLDGIRDSSWTSIISNKWYHPLQEAFYRNLDIFNVMFLWQGSFEVLVLRQDGSVQVQNLEKQPEDVRRSC